MRSHGAPLHNHNDQHTSTLPTSDTLRSIEIIPFPATSAHARPIAWMLPVPLLAPVLPKTE